MTLQLGCEKCGHVVNPNDPGARQQIGLWAQNGGGPRWTAQR